MLNGEPLVGEPQDEEMDELEDDITQEVPVQIFNPRLTASWRCVWAPRCAGTPGESKSHDSQAASTLSSHMVPSTIAT